MTDYSTFEDILEHHFQNPDLLRQALVHRSYLNENPDFPLGHNERLEYLGDAVLELVVSDYLYHHYPNPEGDLTNWRASLVNAKALSDVAKDLDLDSWLLMSRGEAKDKQSNQEHLQQPASRRTHRVTYRTNFQASTSSLE